MWLHDDMVWLHDDMVWLHGGMMWLCLCTEKIISIKLLANPTLYRSIKSMPQGYLSHVIKVGYCVNQIWKQVNLDAIFDSDNHHNLCEPGKELGYIDLYIDPNHIIIRDILN